MWKGCNQKKFNEPLLRALLKCNRNSLHFGFVPFSHEPEFSNFFHTLFDCPLTSISQVKWRDALRSSKITYHLRGMETQEKGASDSEPNSGAVIVVD